MEHLLLHTPFIHSIPLILSTVRTLDKCRKLGRHIPPPSIIRARFKKNVTYLLHPLTPSKLKRFDQVGLVYGKLTVNNYSTSRKTLTQIHYEDFNSVSAKEVERWNSPETSLVAGWGVPQDAEVPREALPAASTSRGSYRLRSALNVPPYLRSNSIDRFYVRFQKISKAHRVLLANHRICITAD